GGGKARPGDNGKGTDALLLNIRGVAVDRDGSVYFSDAVDHRIRRLSVDGVITTIAGTGTRGFSGDGGLARIAQVAAPAGLALDSVGNLYFADTDNRRIRRISIDGIISTVAGGGTVFPGTGVAGTKAALYDPMDVAVGEDES